MLQINRMISLGNHPPSQPSRISVLVAVRCSKATAGDQLQRSAAGTCQSFTVAQHGPAITPMQPRQADNVRRSSIAAPTELQRSTDVVRRSSIAARTELQRSTDVVRRSSIATPAELQRSIDGVRRTPLQLQRSSIATPAKFHCSAGSASVGVERVASTHAPTSRMTTLIVPVVLCNKQQQQQMCSPQPPPLVAPVALQRSTAV